jgi:hypothetical protein
LFKSSVKRNYALIVKNNVTTHLPLCKRGIEGDLFE